jgi:small-conductance mechanosensitive channel
MPLQQACARVAEELEALHGRLERLEAGLETALTPPPPGLEGRSIAMIQEIDMLRQSLGALADYIGQLAREAEADGRVDARAAIASVPLRAMAERLAGRAVAAPAPGQPELF